MREPTRLRWERGSALEHALLRAGAESGDVARARRRTLAALGVAGSASLVGGAAAASTLSSAAKVAWAKVVLGVSLVGAAAAIPVGYHLVHRAEPPAAEAPRVVAAAPAPARRVTGPAAMLPTEDPALVRAVRAVPARPRPMLSRELAALDAARATLASGEPREALDLLDIYAESFPRGRLELEAEVLRIDALAKSGQTGAAQRRAQDFLRRHPQSLLAARVRAESLPVN